MSNRSILKAVMALILVSLPTALVNTPVQVNAASTTPPLGSWPWCTDTVVNGCIEAVTTVSPEKVSATYFSSSELPSGLRVSATCSGNGPATSCDGNKFANNANGICATRPDWVGGGTTPSVEMDIYWPSRSGWEITLRLSTGDFLPAFLIGHGTRSTKTTSDGDGTYTFEFTSIMEFAYSAPMSASRIPADIATFGQENVHVQLWPKDHLLSSYMNQPMGAGSPISIGRGPCVHYPFSGAWAEANAQGFSWSYANQTPTIGLPETDSPTVNKLTFQASAPHYKPQVGSQPLEVIPARVQVFLPTAYFRSLGYQTLDEFDASSYSVVTADGQATTPSVTKRDDGLVINLGISHYSAPNPAVTFVIKGNALPTTESLAATTPLVRTKPSVTTSPASPKIFSVKKGGVVSSSRIARELQVSLKSAKKVVLVVAGQSQSICRSTGLSIKSLKKGTCTVSLKVTAKNGKTKTYKQRITVT